MEYSERLNKLMSEELPNITYQKRKLYRTTQREVYNLFDILNEEVFDNQLPKPKIIVKTHMHKMWGECQGFYHKTKNKKSKCVILLNKNWYCKQWLITILAHEMAHQYQWDIQGEKRILEGKNPTMNHGPSFYRFKKKLNTFGIPLRYRLSPTKWFATQNLLEC